MTEQVMEQKQKKYGKPVAISGMILGVVAIITGICVICKASGMEIAPNMIVIGTAWCLLAFPLAIFVFILCLMWNHVKDAKQAQVKMVVTIFLMFIFSLYSMLALLFVWIAKVDNIPAEDTVAIGYETVQEVESFV